MAAELSLDSIRKEELPDQQPARKGLPQKPNAGDVAADEFSKSIAGKSVKDQIASLARALAVTDVANARVQREKGSSANTWAPITSAEDKQLFATKLQERKALEKFADQMASMASKQHQDPAKIYERSRDQLARILKGQLKAMASSTSSAFKFDGDAAVKLLKSEAASK